MTGSKLDSELYFHKFKFISRVCVPLAEIPAFVFTMD